MRYLLLILCVVLMGSDCEETRLDSMDNGRLQRDGIDIYPCQLPYHVIIDDSVYDPNFGFDTLFIDEMMEFWNQYDCGTGVPWFVYGEPDQSIQGSITIATGYTGDGDEYFDEAIGVPGTYLFAYGPTTYCVQYGTVTVSSDITYDDRTVRDTLIHEGGHVIGLDDDYGSEDLNSVMGSPLVYRGELTSNDEAEICGW